MPGFKITDHDDSEAVIGVRKHIAAIREAKSQFLASYNHAYALGWIGALRSVGRINEKTSERLVTEVNAAFEHRCP